MTVAETAAWLSARDNFCILTHRNPDGDTIGCAAALCRGLRGLGKTACVLENPQFTPRYAPYLAGLLAPEAPEGAVIVSVDMAAETLLPDNAKQFAGRIAMAVDHHGSNSGFAPDRLVDPAAAACGELIFQILRAMGAPLTRDVAEAVYVAVSTDTGCFQYSNTTAQTLRIAAETKDLGCDAYPINKLMFGTKSFARLQLESRLTASMELLAGGRLAVCRLPRAWMGELGLTEDDIDSIAGFPRSVEGVEVGVMLREMADGSQKISLRTAPSCDASAVCAHLGGGGHRAAAGATAPGSFESAREAVLGALRAEGFPA